MSNSLSRRASAAALPIASAVLIVAALAAPAPSQCFGPDNLDNGPCCGLVNPVLPAFDDIVLPSLGVCWSQCAVAGTQDLVVTWTAPNPTFCAEYTTDLKVTDANTGLSLLAGKLTLDYTRTWNEIDPSGADHQVWRFTVKGELAFDPGGAVSPCVIPNCIVPLGPHGTAFYYGYMDYTTCAAGTPFEAALVLYHACDRFIHQPGLSDKPGAFHPGGSFAIVAPHTSLQPFVPQNLAAPQGPLVAEAVRKVDTTALPPLPCTVEDRIAQGDMLKLGRGCVCTLSQNPKHQTLRRLSGTTNCVNAAGLPGTFTTLNVSFPTIPWLHLVSSSIGCWTNPNVYPGAECAWVDEGIFARQDACAGDFVELKYGGTTTKGWDAFIQAGITNPTFTDLTDNWSAPLFGPYPGPIVGSVHPTDHLIYVNTP